MRLVTPVKDKGYALIDNLGRVLETADMTATFYGVPVWKHFYHTLYWFDYWFAGQARFIGAPFHAEGLESIDTPAAHAVTKAQLQAYYMAVAEKSRRYLDSLTDADLAEQPPQSGTNRLGLILGQFRHVYAHLGNINGVTILVTGQWPFVSGSAADAGKPLFE